MTVTGATFVQQCLRKVVMTHRKAALAASAATASATSGDRTNVKSSAIALAATAAPVLCRHQPKLFKMKIREYDANEFNALLFSHHIVLASYFLQQKMISLVTCFEHLFSTIKKPSVAPVRPFFSIALLHLLAGAARTSFSLTSSGVSLPDVSHRDVSGTAN